MVPKFGMAVYPPFINHRIFTVLNHPSLESFNHLLVIVKWRGNQPIVEIYGTVKIPVFDWLVEKPEVIC